MYIATGTRPDIAYAVGHLASYLDCYGLEHWEAAIQVLRYLKGTCLLCLRLGGTNPLQLIGHSDSDYANCPDTSRSIGGYCFTLGSRMVLWSSKKQCTIADSSCYAEYIHQHFYKKLFRTCTSLYKLVPACTSHKSLPSDKPTSQV